MMSASCFFLLRTRLFGDLFRLVALFERLCRLHLFGGNGEFERLRLLFAQFRLRLGDLRLGEVFALDRLAVCLSHAHALLHFGVRFADGTDLVRLGDGDLRVVDGFRRRFLTQSDNIRNVYVDETETDLFEFSLDVAGDGLQKFIAVGVDLLDVHGGDDQAQLTEDDIFREFLYLVHFEVAQALGRVFHDRRFGGNADREDGRHVDTDILPRQRAL